MPTDVDLFGPPADDRDAVKMFLDNGISGIQLADFSLANRESQEAVVQTVADNAAVALFRALVSEPECQHPVTALAKVLKARAMARSGMQAENDTDTN